MTSDELVRLKSLEAIRQLKARYCRFVDTKQWPRLKKLFTADARLEGFGTIPDGTTPERFVDGIAVSLANAVTVHHVHNPEIVLRGDSVARGVWAMVDYVQFKATTDYAGGNLGWVGWGYYEEEYANQNGNWVISHMRLARVRMDVLTPDYPPVKPGRIGPDPNWL